MTRLGLAMLLGAAAGLLAATQPITDTDLFWHLATGRETLAHGIVRVDLFSWTVRGSPVSTDQWLGQVLLYVAYLAGDWRGIAVLRVLVVVALVALVAANASLASRRPLAITLATIPALLLTRPVWVDRPELPGLALFAATLVLLRLGRAGSGRALAASVAVIVLWANVHGSFALGVVLTVLISAEGAWRDAPRRRAYALTALGAIVASLATPAGPGAWTAPGLHFLSPPRDIEEWALIDLRTPIGVTYALTLGLVLLAALRGPRLPIRELVVLVPVAFLSLTAVRQAPLLAIAAAPLFAERSSALLARAGSAVRPRDDVAPSRAALRVLASLAVPALLLIAAIAIAPSRTDERAYPTRALGALPAGDGVLARYEWGGWLIWRAPRTPVFVDGRLTPYLGPVLDDYRTIVGARPGWEEVAAARGVRALLVRPNESLAVRAVERGWRIAYEDDVAVVLLR